MIEKHARDILAAAVDGAVVETPASDQGHDLLVRTRDGRAIAVQVKWAGKGWPQDVRDAARDVVKPWPAEVVLLARCLSPGAIEWLRDLGANWADGTGRARIFGPDGLIVVREVPESRPARRRQAFAWSASAIDLAELILSRQDAPLRATALAHRSRWSVPQVANVLKSFDEQGWTVKRGTPRGPRAYRELIDPDGMLGAWSDALAHTSRASRLAHRATRDVMHLLREQLAPALSRETGWAISGWAGLELAAPFATAIPSLHVYVAERDFAGTLSSAIEAAGLREVDQGGRVTFWRAGDGVLDLAEHHEGIPVVSPVRLYADLASLGARSLDGAVHVKEQLIDPLHGGPASPEGEDG